MLLEVIPATQDCGNYNYQHDCRYDQLALVLDSPMDRLLRDLQRGSAEFVLFELATGFCAHELPFYVERIRKV